VSAYFCSNSVFHLIATYATTQDPRANLANVWRQLITENLRSMNCRYPDDQADNVKTAAAELALITDRPMLPLPAPGIIRSALSEYDYQACEHPKYSSTETGLLVARLLAGIDEPASDHPAGWYLIDELPQAQQTAAPELPQLQPQPISTAAPTPEADPMAAARASLMAAFNAPAAPEPQPAPTQTPEPADPLETIATTARVRALAVLLTLSRLANGSADAERFSTLANRIGSTINQATRSEASAEAARNVAAIQAVWNAA